MSILYEDDFNRTEASGIGRASDYNTLGEDDSITLVNGSEIEVDAGQDFWWQWDGAPTTHGYYYFDFYVPADPEDFDVYYEVDSRLIGGFATYIYAYSAGSGGDWEIGAYSPSGPDAFIETTLTASTWYRVLTHLDTAAEMVRIKIWQRDAAEPGTWGDEVAHNGGQSGSWDPWLGVEGAVAEVGRFDNLYVSDAPLETGPHFNVSAWIDGTLDITSDIDVDAIVFRTWTPPAEPHLPTLIGYETATEDNSSTLTIPIHADTEPNDLVIVAVSWDKLGSTSLLGSLEFTPSDLDLTAIFTQGIGASSSDQRLSIYTFPYQTAHGSELTVLTRNSVGSGGAPVATAKAGACVTWRNASEVELLSFVTNGTYFFGEHPLQSVSLIPGSAQNYDMDAQHMGFWAGAGFGAGRWDYSHAGPEPFATEVLDVTAANWANLVAYEWVDARNHIDEQNLIPRNVSDNSLRSEPNLNALLWVRGLTTSFRLEAEINPGGTFSMDSIVAGPISTKHDRTQYHYGVTPAENILSSQVYGAISAGSTLEEVLEELDGLITDLENGV